MKDLDFENSIGVIIKRAATILERTLEEKMIKEFKLTGGKWKIIVGLAVKDGITQKELADMIFLEPPTLVPIIDKMQKAGLVQRKKDSKDRRNNLLFLTKKAKDIVDSIIDSILELRVFVSKEISEKDMMTAKQVLAKITQNSNKYYNKLRK